MTKTPLDHNGSEVFLYGMHLHLGDHVFINYGADFLGKRENDFTILVGREYDFTESGGTGVISSDAAFFCVTGPFQAQWVSAAPLHLREPG